MVTNSINYALCEAEGPLHTFVWFLLLFYHFQVADVAEEQCWSTDDGPDILKNVIRKELSEVYWHPCGQIRS